jgi:hypothetical protein
MRRATAVKHLAELTERLDELRAGSVTRRLPVVEVWASGELLSAAQLVEAGEVVLVLDLPADELTSLARPRAVLGVEDELRLGKRPLDWWFRPVAWPPWSLDHPAVVRIWSRDGGTETQVIDLLRDGRIDQLAIVEPSGEDILEQLPSELDASRNHLRRVLDSYWDRDWRQGHGGIAGQPEDHLWRAARAASDLLDALEGVAELLDGEGTIDRSATVHRLKVTLRDVKPPVWRRILVASDTTLEELAALLEGAMGWLGGHLHQFVTADAVYGRPDPDEPPGWGPPTLDERAVTLADVLTAPGAKLRWDYDFGDGWEHDVVVESIDAPAPGVDHPVCTGGRRACPPEDCGGPWGYSDLLVALEDPEHPRHDELTAWTPPGFDPAAFRAAEATAAMHRPRPLNWEEDW